jgi:hypothetical protein
LLVRKEVVGTSTRKGAGEVGLVCTPIGVDVQTSTRVRVGEVVGFTPKGVVLEICVDSVLCEADEVDLDVIAFTPEGVVLEMCVGFTLCEVDDVDDVAPRGASGRGFDCDCPRGVKLRAFGFSLEDFAVRLMQIGCGCEGAPECSQFFSLGKGQGFVGQFLQG